MDMRNILMRRTVLTNNYLSYPQMYYKKLPLIQINGSFFAVQ